MAKVLGSTVGVFNPETQSVVALLKGSPLPDWAEGLVHESRLIDEQVASLFDRLRKIGATDDEIAAVQVIWDQLDDADKTDADIDVSDEDLREQLAEMRAAAAEHGVTISEALAKAAFEKHDVLPADAVVPSTDGEPPATPEPIEPSKSIDDMTKAELEDELDKLRAAGVDIEVAPPGNKPEIADALRKYLEG